MQHVHIPQSVKNQPQTTCGDISFVRYKESSTPGKHRVVFNCNAISFIINGVKDIYKSAQHDIINTGDAVLITEGHSIIAEHSVNTSQYQSILIFFPTEYIVSFLNKMNIKPADAFDADNKLVKFKQSPYLAGYLQNLMHIIQHQPTIPQALGIHKLEELFLSIPPNHLSEMAVLFKPLMNDELSLKKLIEKNLVNNLTLDEIAFLANKSLSSFKRDFEKTYGVSPGKYIRQRKLEIASAELSQGKRASELYIALGYESVSNFTSAFKKQYGLTPKQYQLQQKSA
ncbi:MAG: AraC family transcriptional regulator [Mucilaginibacter sp.]|uniref:helix-turn-helix domain-containing protein n=1 Tax=Mucilaginibacter sp. TaxID=1882438 RepID=UPI0032663B85